MSDDGVLLYLGNDLIFSTPHVLPLPNNGNRWPKKRSTVALACMSGTPMDISGCQ